MGFPPAASAARGEQGTIGPRGAIVRLGENRVKSGLTPAGKVAPHSVASARAPMQIRPARPTDAPQIAALVAAVWIDTYATDGVTPAIAQHVLGTITAAKISAELARPGRLAWVATQGDGVLGFADLQPDQVAPCLGPVRQAEILHLYVNERHLRRGIGSALLRTCCDVAFALGCAAVWLSVWAENDRALRFYESHGWEWSGDTTFRLGPVEHANRIYVLRGPPRG
jgi:diamine N-acetyltransferase